jgi:DNA modification methylase
MEPYYDDGTCVIYHGDCLDVIPSITDVGMVLTSPPYNLNGDGTCRRTNGSC